jgi:hypothetical protein
MSFPIAITQTFPENWPAPLKDLAAPMTSIVLTQEDALALGAFSTEFRRQLDVKVRDFFSDALLAEIDAALLKYPEGVMPRIGYCSWKASLIEKRPAKTRTDLLQIITTDDPRVGNALAVLVGNDDPVVLHLRAWRSIPDWSEVRLFFKNGKFVGASQYAYRHSFPEIANYAKEIEAVAVRAASVILEKLHVPDVIVDLALQPIDGQSPQAGVQPLLIELNPFSPLTDPCLFSWEKGGDFDGRFRWS